MPAPLPCLLALALASASPPTPQARADELFPYPLRTDRLPNGLTVTRVPFPSPGLVAYYSVVRVGSRNEVEPGKTGFAHFFEHMMFKGTPRFPEGERDRVVAGLGFNDNAFTADDVTVYHSFGPSSGLEKLVELEADRFRHLAYSEPSFQTEALAVLGEYHKTAASPELRMEERLLATAFRHHPYQHTTLGFLADIQAMPRAYAYSRDFFQRWYTPDNTLLFIVGDFDDSKLMASVRQHYGPWVGEAAPLDLPAEPPQAEERHVHVDWPAPAQPRLVHAWRTPAASLATPDSAIQSALAAYLAGPGSPLQRDLVLERQLAESLHARYTPHRDPHLFHLVVTLKQKETRPTVQAALDAAVQALARGEVDRPRFEAVKSHLRYSVPMQLETADAVAEALAWYAGIHGTPDALLRHTQRLRDVTPEQLVAFAREHLQPSRRTVLTLDSTAAPPAPPPAPGARR